MTEPQPIPKPRLPRQPALPEEQLGHCMVCGAGFAEYIACEMPDCVWVREQKDDAA